MNGDLQWTRSILSTLPGDVLAVVVLYAILLLCLIMAGTAFYMTVKRHQGVPFHKGYIRFALIFIVCNIASLLWYVGDLYQADGWQWLTRVWGFPALAGTVLFLAAGTWLAMKLAPRFQHFIDPRIGEDE